MTGIIREDDSDGQQHKDLGHLSAAVGHHVINAFSAVVSNAELIRSHASDPSHDPSELAALGSAIVETALGASHVARRLIDWTRRVTSLDYESTGREPEMVDLNQVIRETVEAEKDAPGPKLEWVLNLGPIPVIRGDPGQLRSMLRHLIQNGRESLLRGEGTITFTTLTDDRNWVLLEIRDTGLGMVPEVHKRATEPFFTTRSGHSGVGLTVAHGIWRRHRGALSVESHPGQGTLVRLAVEPSTVRRTPYAPPRPPEVEQPTQPTEQDDANPAPEGTT